MKQSRVVVLLTPELMYLQRPHTHIKEQARRVEEFIPRAKFPPKLGFIELPYSQGPSFFTNLAIYHEIGHFVYEELSHLESPHPAFANLDRITIRSLNSVFGKSAKDRQTFALGAKIVENWVQEIFCDLFAIRLVGPAFSFALIEILGMLGFLSATERVRFDQEHPAAACRFAEHIKMLREDSWWDAIADIDPEQKKLLEELSSISRSKYSLYVDDRKLRRKRLVDAFIDSVVPAIRKLVRQITPDTSPAVNRFRQERRRIEDCLRIGVVPHGATSDPPDPVSIVNSAFCFYLTSLPKLIEDFEGVKAKYDVAVYSRWADRLEKWTMKAIEDSQIQTQFGEGTALWSFLRKKS